LVDESDWLMMWGVDCCHIWVEIYGLKVGKYRMML